MPTNEYRRHATECLCIADGTTNPEHKMLLIAMAQAWLRLARQAEDLSADIVSGPNAPPNEAYKSWASVSVLTLGKLSRFLQRPG
jgi:hypothetical protein